MKSRLVILVLVMVCLWGPAVYADTVVNLSANLCSVCPPPAGVSTIDLQAQLTVAVVDGTFFDPGLAEFFTGSFYEVQGVSGTLNGNSISSFTAPLGDGSWLNSNLSLGAFYFSSGGFECWLENEGNGYLIVLVADNGAGGASAASINYEASIVTPEPSPLFLVGLIMAGSALIPLVRWAFLSRPGSSKAL